MEVTHDEELATTFLLSYLIEPILSRLERTKRYATLIAYYNYYIEVQSVRAAAKAKASQHLQVQVQAQLSDDGLFVRVWQLLYSMLCVKKQQLLVGVADPSHLLWIPLPDLVNPNSLDYVARPSIHSANPLELGTVGLDADNDNKLKDLTVTWAWIADSVLPFLPLLSGRPPQQNFDRLMMPEPNSWSNFIGYEMLEETFYLGVERNIMRALGFDTFIRNERTHLNRDDYENVLAEARLNQRNNLIEGRPVLVKISDNLCLIKEIILMQKGHFLLARMLQQPFDITTTIVWAQLKAVNSPITRRPSQPLPKSLDLLAAIDLDTGRYYGFPVNLYHRFGEQAMDCWSVQTLIATVYRDLVTVDVVERHAETSGKHQVSTGIDGNGDTNANLNTNAKLSTTKNKVAYDVGNDSGIRRINWMVLPRRRYMRTDDETTVERRALTSDEVTKREQFRAYHSVSGFVRKLPANWKSSDAKKDEALQLGVILRDGETWVRPHGRGLNKLVERGEIDLDSIPHYIRRPRTRKFRHSHSHSQEKEGESSAIRKKV
jgi:hypothetical protein